MKIRNGFVSNSSSSSFMIRACDLTLEQVGRIEDHIKEAGEDYWSISVDAQYVRGRTFMDNFDMRAYLRDIGIDLDKVEWED